MKKPTIYLDTTVISSYWYEGNDVLALARRLLTRDWWENERQELAFWASTVTLAELNAGRYPRQADAFEMADRLRILALNHAVREFSHRLMAARIVPTTKPNDAMQMAVASVHEVCYLLTWNYAHLANPQAQESLERVCRDAGHRAPIIVTPESIPSTRRGQNIRRTRNADR